MGKVITVFILSTFQSNSHFSEQSFHVFTGLGFELNMNK